MEVTWPPGPWRVGWISHDNPRRLPRNGCREPPPHEHYRLIYHAERDAPWALALAQVSRVVLAVRSINFYGLAHLCKLHRPANNKEFPC